MVFGRWKMRNKRKWEGVEGGGYREGIEAMILFVCYSIFFWLIMIDIYHLALL